eukprot:CAMPEP_0115108706 /NCGR_PEP_ID=MMETSP0227-20121206/38175_1 /TAXON_ID=89957 /ORGANISM="Polarella glacialis, Strain CCMP 1383" /LENGTH=51 /DNA_ID=CAMNT_0002507075 /DNA_START=79 /DNA_END=231 /DNA_ORIENTATION=+
MAILEEGVKVAAHQVAEHAKYVAPTIAICFDKSYSCVFKAVSPYFWSYMGI